MKIILIFLLLISTPAMAQDTWQEARMSLPIVGGAGVNVCSQYLICQGFEGTGYDNSESWTEQLTSGTVNEDYTATVLVGSQSLAITNASDLETIYAQSPTFTAQDNVYVYTQYRTPSVSVSYIALIYSGSTYLCGARIVASTLRAECNVSDDAVTTFSADTTYHVWLEYEKGTGSNGKCRAAFSTDGVKPTSGDNFAEATTCNATAQGDRIRIGYQSSTSPKTNIYDKVRVKTSAIGSNPE